MRNALFAVLVVVMLPFQVSAQDKVTNYINTYQDIAISEMQRSGIPASITLAQGMFESAYGESPSAISYNNHFGIKCKKEWVGRYYFKHDDDRDKEGNLIPSCFRAYPSASESFADHTNFLVERERYQELFTYHHTDYFNWAKGLQKCGYATNPKYADRLVEIIERYSLWQYDQEGQPVFVTTETAESTATDQIILPVATDAFTTPEGSVDVVVETMEVMEETKKSMIIEHVDGIGEVVRVTESMVQAAPVDTVFLVNTAPKVNAVVTPEVSRVNRAIILPTNYTRRSVSAAPTSSTKMK